MCRPLLSSHQAFQKRFEDAEGKRQPGSRLSFLFLPDMRWWCCCGHLTRSQGCFSPQVIERARSDSVACSDCGPSLPFWLVLCYIHSHLFQCWKAFACCPIGLVVPLLAQGWGTGTSHKPHGDPGKESPSPRSAAPWPQLHRLLHGWE